MQIGIAGLPGAGKTTLFNALAHQHAQVGGYTGAEPNLAVV
jgi:ribosome-binding ATPase YchF (GTP1/OBG family)